MTIESGDFIEPDQDHQSSPRSSPPHAANPVPTTRLSNGQYYHDKPSKQSEPDTHQLLEPIKRKFGNCPELIRSVTRLRSGADRITKYAHEYDLNKFTPGNGHRSFVRMVQKFERLLISDRCSFEHLEHLLNCSNLLNVLCDHIEGMRECSKDENREHLKQFCADEQFNMRIFEQGMGLEQELSLFYGMFNNFWLCESMMNILNYFYISLICLFWSPRTFYRMLDKQYRGRTFAEFSQNVTLKFIKPIWHLAEIWPYRAVAPVLMYGWRPRTVQNIFVETRSLWTIRQSDSELIYKLDPIKNCQRKIRCRLLRNRLDPDNETLLYHMHGAGFVAQTPESHDVYLRDWAIRLDTVPIISVDYSLLPDAKFPVAVQEVLDVYLWLTMTSDKEHAAKVRELVGFLPKKVVFVGDSAGASLCLSLAIVLSEINRKIEQWDPNSVLGIPEFVYLPSAIVAMYPCTNLAWSTNVSKLFCSFDTFLNTGIILEIARHYVPIDHEDLKECDPDREVPWYRRSDRSEIVEKYSARAKDPFISHVYYERFERLSKVKLFVISGEFDAMLDDSVALCRAWQGPVTLDIMKDLPHGFLYFLSVCNEAKVAAERCADRIFEAVGVSSVDYD